MDKQTESQPEGSPGDIPLVVLFRHNLWANLRLFDTCVALDEEQLAATTIGTFGAIYNTLRHIVAAEQSYLFRLSGQQSVPPLQREDNPDVAVLRAYVQRSGEGLIAFAGSSGPSDVLPMEWDEQRWPVPASLILTQVMTILTQEGVEPPDLSGWAYIEEHITPTAVE